MRFSVVVCSIVIALFALAAAPASAGTSRADSLVRADPTLTAELLPSPRRRPAVAIEAALRQVEMSSRLDEPSACAAAVFALLRAHPRDAASQVLGVEMLSRIGLGHYGRMYCDSLWRADSTSALTATLMSKVVDDSADAVWADRAVRLDPSLATAWYARGQARWSRDLNGGLRDFLRALSLDPSFTDAWRVTAWCFSARHDSIGMTRAYAGMVASDSTSLSSLLLYARARGVRPRWGLAMLDAVSPGLSPFADGLRGQLCARAGDHGRAREIARSLALDPEHGSFASEMYARASVFASLGSADTAFACLARALEAGFTMIPMLQTDEEAWRVVWADPRYATLERALAHGFAESMRTDMVARDSTAVAIEESARVAAPVAELRDAGGQLVSLDALRGRIVLLDFWSAWCGWCRAGMSLLSDYLATLPADSVVAFSVQVQELDSTAWMRGPGILRAGHIVTRYARGTRATQESYHAEELPTLVVVDRRGRIALAHTGYLHDPRSVLDPILTRLRAEPASP